MSTSLHPKALASVQQQHHQPKMFHLGSLRGLAISLLIAKTLFSLFDDRKCLQFELISRRRESREQVTSGSPVSRAVLGLYLGGLATIGGSCQKFLSHGLINEVTWYFHAQGIPPLIHWGLSQLCTSSFGVLVLAYVISPPWVLLSRALKLCTCSVGPGRQKRKEKVSNWSYCQVQPQTLPKLYKES